MEMISSDDSFSSSSQRTLRRSNRQTNNSSPTVVFPLSPTQRAISASEEDIPTHPSTTLISPKQWKRTVLNDSSSGSKVSEGSCTKVKPPSRKKLKVQSDHQVPKFLSQPCLHPDAKTKPVKQRRSPKSPATWKKKGPLPKHSLHPQCSTKVLKRPVKAASKKGSRLSKATVEQGDTSPNVLTTGTKTDSLAKKPGSKTSKNDTIIKSVKASNKSARKQPMTKDQSGGTMRKRKETNQSQTLKVDSGSLSLPRQSAELSASLQSSNSPTVSRSSVSSSPSTPKRARGRPRVLPRPRLSSTPDRSSSTDNPFSVSPSPLASKIGLLQDTSPISSWKVGQFDPISIETTPESEAGKPLRKVRGRPRKQPLGMTTQGNKKRPSQTGKSEPESHAGGADAIIQPPTRSRPRFELQESMSSEQGKLDPGDTSQSSDLSIELSLQEDHLTSLTFQEEEEEEEELPSFLMQMDKKPLSIAEGICVWCKFRHYPFWPAMVKRVNHKLKKASIVFIDDRLFDKKIRKGFSVALKTLKPFDCEEASQLVSKAKEKYDAAIKWCMELISDYRIRIGCGSFVGSLIEYFANDISCPVRRKYPQGTSDLTFPTKLIMEEQGMTSDDHDDDESSSEQQEEPHCKKLLPDRSRAARNRANEKLVHFIKQGKVDKHLLAVISGQRPSRWLKSFLKASRLKLVDTYLEDEEQLDQVYDYLLGVYKGAPHTTPDLAHVADPIRLVLDVLLPEAIIFAIAGVDKVSLANAEDKYLKGHCLSKREREEFDLMIEQQMRMKAIHQHPAH